MANKESIKDKMLLNYSLLGKITESGKAIDGSRDYSMELTKNQDEAFESVETSLTISKRIFPDIDNFLQYSFDRGIRKRGLYFYLQQQASLERSSRLKKTMLTRAQYYKFVEK